MMRRTLLLLGLLLPAMAGAAITYTPGPWKLLRAGVFVADHASAAACDTALRAQTVNIGQTVHFKCVQTTSAKGVANPPAPVDCVVGPWSAWNPGPWSACSAGQQSRQETRTRQVIVAPSGGGAACPALTETQTVTQSCGTPPPPQTANYPLELASPRAAGSVPVTGGRAIPATHRIFKAYPGLEYNIRAVVIGGAYPYTFALSGGPAGMTINSRTGEVSWPNPGATASPTISVTDSEGVQRTSSWTITVTTSGFKFVDRVNGTPGGDGSIGNPWQDLLQVYNASASGQFLYFRNGTYTNAGIPRTGSNGWERVEFRGQSHPMVWLAYPGESPRYDAGYSGSNTGALLRFQTVDSTPVYLDGLEVFNFRNIGVQIVSGTSDYSVFRRLKIHDMALGIEGGNPAGIMFMDNYSDPTHYGAVQNSEFYNLNNGGGLKFYSHKKVLVEDNTFRDSGDGFDLKTHVPRFEVRGNTFRNISRRGLYGNMHFGGGGNGEAASGEWRFNNINTPSAEVSADVNQDGEASVVYVYRNTINGRAQVREVDAADGPFHFYNNVIVNNDSGTPAGSHITFSAVSVPARVVIHDNLVGFPGDGIIDTNGNLTGSYTQYVGSRGYQLP